MGNGVEKAAWPVDGLVAWAKGLSVEIFGDVLGEPVVFRATPWSTVVRWSVQDSLVWGKAVCPGFAGECALLPVLAARCPDRIVAPLAVERDQGWMLLPDGGPTLAGTADVARWTEALVGYAELQQTFAGNGDELLALGCPDMRPHAAVDGLEAMMERGQVAEHRWLLDAARRVANRLDMDLIPATIQHDDLRPDNVFSDGRVFDWGDANVAHPFASLLTALMPNRPDRPGTAANKADIRDAYLSSWRDVLAAGDALHNPEPTLQQLHEQANLAIMLAPIARVDTWLRAPEAALEIYPGAIDRWVEQLLTTQWP